MDKSDNIWKLGLKLIEENEPINRNTLLFIGNKQGGKTSLIQTLIELKSEIKSTLGLEYGFAKKHRSNNKDVCEIWELGEGSFFTNLIKFVINEENLESLSIVLVLDLSTPSELLIISDNLMLALKERIIKSLGKCSEDFQKKMKEKCDKKKDKLRDNKWLKPFEVPMIIIGTKYDLFQELSLDKKKIINQFLRLFAHLNGASLIYTSIKIEPLLKRIKSVLTSMAFNLKMNLSEPKLDPEQALFIPFGTDSIELIGNDNLELSRIAFENVWPQAEANIIIPEDPAKDQNFCERDIDLIRIQKDEELENYRRELELKKEQIKISIK